MKKEWIIICILTSIIGFLIFKEPAKVDNSDFERKIDSLEKALDASYSKYDSISLNQDTVFIETFKIIKDGKKIENEITTQLTIDSIGIWGRLSRFETK